VEFSLFISFPEGTDCLSEAAARNRDYYDKDLPGRTDYWRFMAAPRFRSATILRALRDRAPRSVVDLGCGSGLQLAEIAAQNPAVRLAGIDLSREQVERNRREYPDSAWFAADLDVPHESLDALAPGLEPFEAVVASEVLEHVDHPQVFLENARLLALPSAWLVLSTQSGRVGETERRVGHVRHFTATELARLLEGTGWQSEAIWNAGLPFHDLSKWWANRDPEASMSRFGDAPYGPRERLICWALRQAFRFNSKRMGAQLFAIARAVGRG
jgi:SAM-dependent methyltransferase